jgi:hypothetical protein
MTERPTHAYFRPKHGAWSGEFVFTLESLRALFAGSMGLVDKIGFAMLGWVCRVLGPFRIRTTVDASRIEEGRVGHTTHVSKWGVPLMWSVETFALGADGQTLEVDGVVRSGTWLWIGRRYRESRGRVDDDGLHASYEFAWAGAKLRQRSTPEGDGLRFAQELDGCRASFVLRRSAAA